VFALIAGLAAYRAGQNQAAATLQAARDQIAVNAKKDRSQAHAIAVAIYPEILLVGQKIERAHSIIREKFPEIDPYTKTFEVLNVDADVLRELKVVEPPLIRENGHRLFVMGEAGATIFQLLGVILQYNRMIETLATQIPKDEIRLTAVFAVGKLWGHLQAMETLVQLAEQQVAPIHDQKYVA
jgi:hypothetical protein